MRLRHKLIISLLYFVQSAFAQNWVVSAPHAYNHETVVYATVQSNVPTDPMTDFVVGAFIGNQCRAKVEAPTVGKDRKQFFILRVKGDYTADAGKTIDFRVYYKPFGVSYSVEPAAPVMFSGESVGQPSHPIPLSLQRQEGAPVALQGVTFQSEPLAAGLTTRVRLQPVPANATFDAYDLWFMFNGTMKGWKTIQAQSVVNDPLSFDFTPAYPGSFKVQLMLNTSPVKLLDAEGQSLSAIEVGGLLQLEQGWQWRSNAYGDIAGNSMQAVFSGSALAEARSQQSLLFNDPELGYFGPLLQEGIAQNTCYKVKMNTTPAPAVLLGGHFEQNHTQLLSGEWTWVGVPYYYDRLLSVALTTEVSPLAEGMVVVSKEDGSAEFDGTQWKGDLSVLRSGQGVMVYNPTGDALPLTFATEAGMPQEASEPQAQSRRLRAWQYDASRFMNNTTIVATLPQAAGLGPDYTIGVFAGNECRGEGHYVDGYFFITAHADRGEQVSLRLRHEPTGRTWAIDGTIATGQLRLGSLQQPLVLQSQAVALGISDAPLPGNSQSAGRACFDLMGRRVAGSQRGIVLRRQADGTVRKVMVHEQYR